MTMQIAKQLFKEILFIRNEPYIWFGIFQSYRWTSDLWAFRVELKTRNLGDLLLRTFYWESDNIMFALCIVPMSSLSLEKLLFKGCNYMFFSREIPRIQRHSFSQMGLRFIKIRHWMIEKKIAFLGKWCRSLNREEIGLGSGSVCIYTLLCWMSMNVCKCLFVCLGNATVQVYC